VLLAALQNADMSTVCSINSFGEELERLTIN